MIVLQSAEHGISPDPSRTQGVNAVLISILASIPLTRERFVPSRYGYQCPLPALIISGCLGQDEKLYREKAALAIQEKFKIRIVILSSAVQVN